MRVVTLENSGRMYTSQVYLVLGGRSQLEDVNTLVDVGADPAILASIRKGANRCRQMGCGPGGRDAQPFRSLRALARGSRGIPPTGVGLLTKPCRRRCHVERWGLGSHGRSAVRSDPYSRSQQRLHLPLQPGRGCVVCRRHPAVDHVVRRMLRSRVSGGVAEAVRPRCAADLLWARSPADRGLQ